MKGERRRGRWPTIIISLRGIIIRVRRRHNHHKSTRVLMMLPKLKERTAKHQHSIELVKSQRPICFSTDPSNDHLHRGQTVRLRSSAPSPELQIQTIVPWKPQQQNLQLKMIPIARAHRQPRHSPPPAPHPFDGLSHTLDGPLNSWSSHIIFSSRHLASKENWCGCREAINLNRFTFYGSFDL